MLEHLDAMKAEFERARKLDHQWRNRMAPLWSKSSTELVLDSETYDAFVLYVKAVVGPGEEPVTWWGKPVVRAHA